MKVAMMIVYILAGLLTAYAVRHKDWRSEPFATTCCIVFWPVVWIFMSVVALSLLPPRE